MMLPSYWIEFLDSHDLRGKTCSLSNADDASGIGVDLAVFSEEESLDEATNFYPGIVVAVDGYVPVARCLSGSGDPYFIKTSEGSGGRLYRVYHDAVDPDGYKAEDAVAIVLPNYEKLLQHIEL